MSSLDYETIVSADLTPLKTAASAWTDMGNKFETLHKDYGDHVKAAVGDEFPGPERQTGLTMFAFKTRAQRTHEEYEAARNEAWAVGKLLDEAHSTLTMLRRAVLDVRDQAIEAGMHVSASGKCTLAETDDDAADTDVLDVARRMAREGAWDQAILNAVQNVRDADHNLKLALSQRPFDMTGVDDGFYAWTPRDAGEAAALHALPLIEKLESDDELAPEERAELARIFRSNDDDPEFSRIVLNHLGVDRTLELSNKISEFSHLGDDAAKKNEYRSLHQSLSDAMATATTIDEEDTAADKQFTDKWLADLREWGDAKYEINLLPGASDPEYVRGYQTLATLMEQGSGYDKEFLHQLADDIRAAEDPGKGGSPDIWDLNAGPDWFARDPLDTTLGVMSQDPDAATEYLDPEGGNDNLKYLLENRDWKFDNEHRIDGNSQSTLKDTDLPDSRVGLGQILEAAATGELPLGEDGGPLRFGATHTEAQARVMQEMIELLDPKGPDGFPDSFEYPENIRRPVANALADYAGDTFEILGRVDDTYQSSNEAFPTTEGWHISPEADSLIRVIRGASDDPGAYAVIHEAQRQELRDGMDRLPDLHPDNLETQDTMRKAYRGLGALEVIREDIVIDQRDNDISEANWNAKVAYHVAGGLVTPFPGGDAAQRGIDTLTSVLASEYSADASAEANAKIAKQYMETERSVTLEIGDWAERRGLDRDSSATNVLQGNAQNYIDEARTATQKALGNGNV